ARAPAATAAPSMRAGRSSSSAGRASTSTESSMSSERRASPRGWPAAALALLALTALVAAPAAGETIDATATTLLSGHADPRDGRIYTVVPAYQSLSLLATDLKIPLVQDGQVVMRAWGEVAFSDHPTATGDVD